MLTNFLSGPDVLNIPVHEAGKMVAFYWGGAMVGRFIGSWLLTRIHAGVLLTLCTAVAAALCLIVTQTGGVTAAYAALAVGFFNSIMFPSIFTLTLERSSAPAAATSGLLVFGIIGGAVLPLLAAQVADRSGDIHLGFFVPVAGYLLLTVFAVACARTKGRDSEGPVASPH
ncbi:L-fucose-proton symporter [compost metagenome]